MSDLRLLIWQWGRRGAMPRFAVELAQGCDKLPGITACLSLAATAEILPHPRCNATIATYRNGLLCLIRLALWPILLVQCLLLVRRTRPELAICVQLGPLDPVMVLALRLHHVPIYLIIHEAQPHPGDRHGVIWLQRLLLRMVSGAIVLSSHVEATLRVSYPHLRIIRASHPPFGFGLLPPRPRAQGGKLRLLFFGRLLPYKGLDLLADAVAALGARQDIVLRVVGQGPDAPVLHRLSRLPWVDVKNRWVPEAELGGLIAWADAVVLPYTEASQSGVAAAALAAGRWLIATDVGGLAEQCADNPAARLCAPNPKALADAIISLINHPPKSAHIRPEPPSNAWARMAAGVLLTIAPHRFGPG